jgi:hypothetical protein
MKGLAGFVQDDIGEPPILIVSEWRQSRLRADLRNDAVDCFDKLRCQ